MVAPKSRDTMPLPRQSVVSGTPAAGGQRSESSSNSLSRSPRPAADRPVLFVLAGPQLGAVFSLESPRVVIGRAPGVDVHMTDDTVSECHAVLMHAEEGASIRDQESRNGTFVNGDRIVGVHPLHDGDRIRVGSFSILKFSMMDELEQTAMATLHELTLLDPLTRLYNRRYFHRRLQSERSFAARHGLSVAVLMIDVDHFKLVNDTRGHPMGDLVLRLVARTVERLMRPEDVLARLSGDEFVVIARATSLRELEILGQRICHRVSAMTFSGPEEGLRVSVSVGGALLGTDTATASAERLLSVADQAMYDAKARGRNQVVVCSVAPDSSPTADASDRPTRPSPD